MTSSYRWVVLAVCAVAHDQAHIHRVGFAPLMPFVIAALGISATAARTLMN